MDIANWIRAQWDRAAAILAVIAGGVALLLGWLGVSRSGLPAEQIPYMASGAVLGLFALGLGATLWLSADMRDEWRKLDDLYRQRSSKVVGERGAVAETPVRGELAAGGEAARSLGSLRAPWRLPAVTARGGEELWIEDGGGEDR